MLSAFAKKLVELFAFGGDVTATPNATSSSVQFVRLQTTAKLYISAVLIACCSLVSLDAEAAATINVIQDSTGTSTTITFSGNMLLPETLIVGGVDTSPTQTRLKGGSSPFFIFLGAGSTALRPAATLTCNTTSVFTGTPSGANIGGSTTATSVTGNQSFYFDSADSIYFPKSFYNLTGSGASATGTRKQTSIDLTPNTATFPVTLSTLGINIGATSCTYPVGSGVTETVIINASIASPPTAPTISDVSPVTGPTAGGTSVKIIGTDFTGATSVKFGGTSASTFTVVNNNFITATTPAKGAGAVSVDVTTSLGTNAANTRFTYVTAPVVSTISPATGSTAGGTSVTINGTDLGSATGVTIGGVAATIVSNSATSITATTGAHAAGTVDVAVTTGGGTGTLVGAFTYAAPASNDATLSAMTISSGTLSPTFASATTTYTASVANSVSSITLTPTRNQANATITVNGTTVASGVASGSIALAVGNNTITTVVTAQDGTTKTYTTTVTRAASANADLSNLVLSSGALGQTFASATTTYTQSVANSVTSLTVTPTVSDSTATVKVNGTTVTSGSASGAISLNVGNGNVITTVVTAQDGTTKTYTTTVTRAASGNAALSNLVLSSGVLSPTFAGGTTGYTASVTNATATITVTPTVAQANATITVNGTAVTSGSASGAINLNVGSNVITTQVTAQDGVTTQTYTTTVTRAASTDANLSAMAISSGTLSPTFASATTAYTASVANATTTITVTPTVAQANATITVNGTAVTSGSASGAISLNVGSNTITTVVTAQDGTTTKTYTVTVTRAASTDATLSAMTISSGTLSPTFASGTTSYTASVANSVSSITLTPTRNQANAAITVNGTAVTSGSASGAISLSVGSNTITTVVTAQDGTTTQTYTTTVTRAVALIAQATLTVSASPTTLNAITTTSTLSTSGGSGTGAVTYAMTVGTCTVSGSTVTAGTASETCTVTATKAADSTYLAATATVNITVARRANIAAAATDASVLAIHGAQIMQSQKFVTTQIENVANHLNAYRNNFNLRPSNFGFGVNIQMPSLGPASQALYKIKDELTPRPEMQAQNKLQSKDMQAGMKKVGYVEEQDLTPYNDYMREEELTAAKAKQKQEQEQKALQEQIDQSQYYAANSQYERENLTYSVWTAGTIDYATYKTGDNKETQNKLTANGLTMGIDYKLHDAAIVGAAVGVGTAWQSAVAINTNLKAKQTAVTGYGMFGFADHWVVEGLMGYGVVDFSGNRTTSDGAAQLGVNRKGETLFSSGTISKMYWVEGYKVTPFARQDVMHINLHSYAETGAADYALGFDGTNFVYTTTSGGLQVSRDIFLEGAKLTPTAKVALNRIRSGGLAQNIYYADTGAAGGVYTLNQSASYMTTQSLSLGLIYTTRAGDGFDIGWQGAMGANQYKLSGLRVAVRFAM